MAKFLVVDDSRFTRTMLRGMLYKIGHEVVGEAENAAQAVQLYQALRPEVVTLDLVLPDDSGLEVLKSIRSDDPKAKVIVVTASGQDKVDAQIMELGAAAILHKPFTVDEFEKVMQGAVSA